MLQLRLHHATRQPSALRVAIVFKSHDARRRHYLSARLVHITSSLKRFFLSFFLSLFELKRITLSIYIYRVQYPYMYVYILWTCVYVCARALTIFSKTHDCDANGITPWTHVNTQEERGRVDNPRVENWLMEKRFVPARAHTPYV